MLASFWWATRSIWWNRIRQHARLESSNQSIACLLQIIVMAPDIHEVTGNQRLLNTHPTPPLTSIQHPPKEMEIGSVSGELLFINHLVHFIFLTKLRVVPFHVFFKVVSGRFLSKLSHSPFFIIFLNFLALFVPLPLFSGDFYIKNSHHKFNFDEPTHLLTTHVFKTKWFKILFII